MNFVAAVVILFVFLLGAGDGDGDAHARRRCRRTRRPQASASSPATRSSAPTGRRGRGWDAASEYLRAHPDETIRLTYLPGGRPPAKTVTVKLDEHPGARQVAGLPRGEPRTVTTRREAPWRAGWLALTGTKDVFKGTFTGFYWLFSGKIDPTGNDGAVGPGRHHQREPRGGAAGLVPDPARLPERQPRP